MYDRLIFLIRRPVLLTFLILTLIGVTALALRPQKKTSSQNQFDESQYPIVDASAPENLDPQERSKREIKAQRFRMEIPVSSNPNVGVAAGIYEWPLNFPALPTKESTAIVVGDVTAAKANLSEDKRSVYSDFTFKPISVLKDDCGLVKQDSQLTASRYGGRVKFPDGHTQLIFMTGLGMPRVGQRYVVFLKQTNADFDLLTAYELRDGKVLPLDTGAPNFSVYENVDAAAFLKTIQENIGSPLKPTCN